MEDKKNADAEPAEESLEQAATIVDAPETDKKDGDPDVIAADKNVPFERVEDALSAVRDAGLSKVGFVTQATQP